MSSYTKEQEEYIALKYEEDPTPENVQRMADELGVTKKSLVGKLASLGVYKKIPYAPKYTGDVVTKPELVKHLEIELGLDENSLTGLANASKPALMALETRLIEKGIIVPR